MIRIAIVLTLSILYSCGTNEVTSSPEELQEKLSFPFNVVKAKSENDIKYIRGFVSEVIKERKKALPNQLWDLPSFYITPYGVAINGRRTRPKDAKGMWLKFDENYTYTYGRYDRIIGEGMYHYADSDEFLLMVDTDSQVEPKLYKLLSNSEFFNFVGQPIMLVDDGSGERMLWKGFAQDGFLQTLKINHEIHNGTQIMMKMEEERPVMKSL